VKLFVVATSNGHETGHVEPSLIHGGDLLGCMLSSNIATAVMAWAMAFGLGGSSFGLLTVAQESDK
jgi:hypothetical protein